MPRPDASPTKEQEVLFDLAELEYRPYDFVMWAFPWGQTGTDLESYTGPEKWQAKVLMEAQAELIARSSGLTGLDPFTLSYNIAIKSGKNVGKSALLSWLIWWAFSTRVNTKGRATANTKTQIQTILWTELAKWHRLGIFKPFFEMSATRINSTDPKYRKEWAFDAIPWSKDNPDAWAGLHNQGGRLIQIFDEAAEIDDSIWERADGATREARTEVFWIVASNPTRNFGRFYDCFHKFSDLWHTHTVDSREVALTDHEAIESAIKLWGEDDDYTRVQFMGEFPTSSFFQLIPTETITHAMNRVGDVQTWEPLILGVDVARYGDNESVCQFRQGRDARSIPVGRRRGLSTTECAAWVASLITTYGPDATFIDEGGIGGGVIDHLRYLGHTCIGVLFGGKVSLPPGGILVADKRAEMYVNIRDWLRTGGLIPPHKDLSEQLASVDYHVKKDQIRLMSKEDMRAIGRPSPDWADALALTFAFPVAQANRKMGQRNMCIMDYEPVSVSALPGQRQPWERPSTMGFDNLGGTHGQAR